MSIQTYYARNNVQYKVLDKWIRVIYKKVVPGEVTDIPAYDEQKSFLSQPQTARTSVINETVSINVNISTSSGMEVSRDGLFYESLGLFTTNRKCSFHFGSDGGTEMSAVYHSIISMLELCDKSVWIFFGDYFRCKFLGLDTYKEHVRF